GTGHLRRRRRDHGAVQADRDRGGRRREGGPVGLRLPHPHARPEGEGDRRGRLTGAYEPPAGRAPARPGPRIHPDARALSFGDFVYALAFTARVAFRPTHRYSTHDTARTQVA